MAKNVQTVAHESVRNRVGNLLREQRAGIALDLAVPLTILALAVARVPVVRAIPVVLMLVWVLISCWLRRAGWGSLGFRRADIWRALGIGASVGVLYQLFSIVVEEPLLARLTGEVADLSQFAPLAGDVGFLALMVIVSVVYAGLGEEMVYRGFIMQRLGDLFGGGRWAQAVALALTSLAFGAAHAYQGLAGMIGTGLSGLVFGLVFLTVGRHNLWAAVAAHAVMDIVGFTLIFLGLLALH